MERKCVDFFSDFFVNFLSSYARYIHDESMCTGYVPLMIRRQMQTNAQKLYTERTGLTALLVITNMI
jgi:hypothetical protein